MRKHLLVTGLVLTLTGCTYFPGVYKMDVPQGNPVTQEQLDQLRPGMTQSQVRYVMGTPLIQDTFNENRWDYVYHMIVEDEMTENRRLTVYFENGRLVRLEGDMRPGQPPETTDTEPEPTSESN